MKYSALSLTLLENLLNKQKKEHSQRKVSLQKQILTIDTKEDSLLEKFIDNAIPERIYKKKHNIFVEERAQIQEKISSLQKDISPILGGIKTIAQFAQSAHDLFVKGDEITKREILSIVSSNLTLKDQKIANYSLNDPFCWLVQDVHSILSSRSTFEPSLTCSDKEKTASHNTACSVVREQVEDVRTFFMTHPHPFLQEVY